MKSSTSPRSTCFASESEKRVLKNDDKANRCTSYCRRNHRMANSRLPNRLGARPLLLLSRVRLQVSAGGDDRASRNCIWHHRHRRQRDSRNLLLHLLNHQPYRRCRAGPSRREESCARWHFHFGYWLSAV